MNMHFTSLLTIEERSVEWAGGVEYSEVGLVSVNSGGVREYRHHHTRVSVRTAVRPGIVM